MTGSKLLARHLLKNSLTLRAFASQVGTTASNVRKWRRGEGTPGIRFALAIEQATAGCVPVGAWLKRRADPSLDYQHPR